MIEARIDATASGIDSKVQGCFGLQKQYRDPTNFQQERQAQCGKLNNLSNRNQSLERFPRGALAILCPEPIAESSNSSPEVREPGFLFHAPVRIPEGGCEFHILPRE